MAEHYNNIITSLGGPDQAILGVFLIALETARLANNSQTFNKATQVLVGPASNSNTYNLGLLCGCNKTSGLIRIFEREEITTVSHIEIHNAWNQK